MNKLAALFESSASTAEYIRGYGTRLAEVVENLDVETAARVLDELERVAEEGKTLFIIGNGGSAAVASHWVNDLCPNSYVEGQKPFRVFCLADNVASVTAIANDSSFDDIFIAQLRVTMQPGDAVLALSVSGNSENVVRAVEYANANGGLTIGLTGFDGGRLAKAAAISLHMPTTKDEYGPVEDLFGILGHVMTGYLTMKRGRLLSH